jgi:deoxyribodipyrimidine photo-lyase
LCPLRQAQRFDAEGEFVRRHVPELAHCSSRALLRPGDRELLATGYPAPMIELRAARQRALATFASAMQSRAEPVACRAQS